jgi:hypothetical protein
MATQPSGMLVPAYVYPKEPPQQPHTWDVLLSASRTMGPGGLVAVANHNDGHFLQADPEYVDIINIARGMCTTVLGYVHDCYNGTKTDENCSNYAPQNVMGDVDRWFSTYHVDGIFIDQVGSRDGLDEPRAPSLVEQIRNRHSGAIVVLNPGSIPSEKFMLDTDPATVVVRETSINDYDGFPPTGDKYAWLRSRANPGDVAIAPRRLAIIAHTAPNRAHVDSLIAKAEQYKIGWVHVQYALDPETHEPITGSIYKPFSIHLSYIAERISICARMGCMLPFGPLFCQLANSFVCYMLRTRNMLFDAARRLVKRD